MSVNGRPLRATESTLDPCRRHSKFQRDDFGNNHLNIIQLPWHDRAGREEETVILNRIRECSSAGALAGCPEACPVGLAVAQLDL